MNPPPAPLRASFDQFATNYDAELARGLSVSGEGKDYFAAGRIRWLQRRLDELEFRPARVLDFGCGTGGSVRLLLGLRGVQRVTGADISEASLEVARRELAGLSADFRPLSDPSEHGAFDLVFCNGVFHHIPPEHRPGAMDYVRKSLKPGGLFALWENNPWNPGTQLVMSRIAFDRDAVKISPPGARRLVHGRGFTVLRQDFLFYFPRALAWFRPVEPWLVGLPLGAQYLTLARRAA